MKLLRSLAALLCLLPAVAQAGANLPPVGPGTPIKPTGAAAATTLGSALSGINIARSITPTNWRATGISPNVTASVTPNQGYAYGSDGTANYNFIFGSYSIDKRADDATWTLIASTTSALNGISGVNHQGGGALYEGKLITPVEQYSSCASNSNQKLMITRASDLTQLSVMDVSAQGAEVSSLAVAPDIGTNGTLFVTSYCTSIIGMYDLASVMAGTPTYLGSLTVSPAIAGAQGIAYKSGTLYLSAHGASVSLATVYSIPVSAGATTGTATALFTHYGATEAEGLNFHGSDIGWFIHDVVSGTSYDQVHFFTPSGSSASLQGIAFDGAGNLTLGAPSGAPTPGAPYVFGSLVIGSGFGGVTPLPDGLTVEGQLSVGGSGSTGTAPITQVEITGRQNGVFGGCIRQRLTGGGGNNGDFTLCPTDNSYGIGGNKLAFMAGTPSSGNTKMVLTGAGLLGVGNTSPTYAVDATGTVRGTTGLISGGQMVAPISTKTAAYTLTATDFTVLGNATTAAFALTLPACSGASGRIYNLKKIDSSTNTVTITAAGSDKIDGAATLVLSSQYATASIQCDGSSAWWKR